MANLLAIDWDADEVRFVLASAAGPRLKIRSWGSEAIARTEDHEGGTDVGRTLLAVMANKRSARSGILVAMGRADIELLDMTLPPARDAELPEMVANEILRQSPQLADDATIDFVSLNEAASEPRVVSAVVCPSELIRRATGFCEEAGITPHRLLVRPFALASFLRSADEELSQASLVVCRVGGEVDLALVSAGRVLYTRTVRMPAQMDEQAAGQRLLAEVRRTLLVAPQSPSASNAVDRVCLLGHGDAVRALAESLTSGLDVPVSVVDPTTVVDCSRDCDPDDADRFAPLVGMLLDETSKQHAVDLIHPRKPPEPPNRRRQLTIAAVVLALVAAFVGFHVWDSLRELDENNAELSQRLRELDQSLKKARSQREIVDSIEDWQVNSVNWLDEMLDFTKRFPSSRDAVVLHMTLTPSRDGGGEIDLNGLVRDPAIVLRMENSVRDSYHQVRSKRIQEREQEKTYTWHFESNFNIRPRDREDYLAHFLGEEATAPDQGPGGELAETVPVTAVAQGESRDVPPRGEGETDE